jgi:hypothetical protein
MLYRRYSGLIFEVGMVMGFFIPIYKVHKVVQSSLSSADLKHFVEYNYPLSRVSGSLNRTYCYGVNYMYGIWH